MEYTTNLISSFLTRLKKDVSEQTEDFDPRVEILKDGLVVIISDVHPIARGFSTHLSFLQLSEVMATEEKWKHLIQSLVKGLLNLNHAYIKNDLSIIYQCTSTYCSKYLPNYPIPTKPKGKQVNEVILDLIVCHTFVQRIGKQCNAVSLIFNNSNLDELLSLEIPVGVLLRSCILDCLYIFAWGVDCHLSHAIASESLLRKHPDLSPDMVEMLNELGTYFNSGRYKSPIYELKFDNILSKLGSKEQIKQRKIIYNRYSKFDHFSLIPALFPDSSYITLCTIIESLHFIKAALCELITIHHPGIDHSEFHDILKLRIEEISPGKFAFV